LRIVRIIGLLVDGQAILQRRPKTHIDLFRETPLLALPGLQFIFFRA
jgi:hypothetical protein